MAKSRVEKKTPSYREALDAMRFQATIDVRRAVTAASSSVPHKVRRKAPRGAHSYALFDGIVDAIAEQIISSAVEGAELDMANAVATMLISRVGQFTCQSRC